MLYKPDTSLYQLPLHGIYLKGKDAASHVFPCLTTLTYDTDQQLMDLNAKPIWSQVDEAETYSSQIQLFKKENTLQIKINCEGTGSFFFTDKHLSICWQGGTDASHYLQTIGMATWLETRNIPCIHANALAINENECILLVAPSRTGKSTLSLKLVECGYTLMTDDMVALYPSRLNKPSVFPSWPNLRLWPDSLDYIKQQNVTSLNDRVTKKVHSRFEKRTVQYEQNAQQSPKSVKAIYYLHRLDNKKCGSCKINSVSSAKALILLLQNSILADAYRPLGVETSRMATLANALEYVPMYELSYNSGLERLNDVVISLSRHINDR